MAQPARDAASDDAGAALPGGRSTARTLLALALPAIVIGIAASLLLLAVTYLADQLEHFLWTFLPHVVGIPSSTWWWILLILTATGLAVGLVVRFVPGHAGPDPATEGLVSAPLRLRVLPSLLLAGGLSLAGGVSLGPENPITAANIALACYVGGRVAGKVPRAVWLAMAVGGTVGALFGTPVAAALLLSEVSMGAAAAAIPLWDRLFAPLLAAAAGSLTTKALAAPTFELSLPPYPGPKAVDLLSGIVIAVAAVGLGLFAIGAFRWSHAIFGRLRRPVLRLTVAGLVLGVLGIIGGPLTLFKGLAQMSELTANVASYTTGGLLLIVAVKVVALVVAASSGFRGGRIFPSVFIGVAVGLLAHAAVPSVPMALAVACGTLGYLVAVTRSGWLSLFMGIAVTGDITLLPVLCLVVLPVWLLATGRPEMQLPGPATASRESAG